MPPSAPLTAVTTVTVTAVLASLLAAPSSRPPVLRGASDASVATTTQRVDEGTTRTVDATDPSDERLPLNGALTTTSPTTVPVTPGGSGWTTFTRKSMRTVTIGGVGTVPADAFGAHLKVTGRWTTKKDVGVLEVRDPELTDDYSIVESPYGTSSYTSSETISTTLSQDGTIEIANHSGTNVDIKVEVTGWYADPDPQIDVGAGVEDGFALIEQIPDAETTTQDDIDAWLAEQGLERTSETTANETADAVQANYDPRTKQGAITVGAAGCVSAIVLAVLSNIFLVSKLAKVKAAIKAVGGAKKAYGALRKAYKTYRKAGHSRSSAAKYAFRKVFNRSGVGKEAQTVLLEIASVQGVLEKCF